MTEEKEKKPPHELTVAVGKNLEAFMKEAELSYRELARFAKTSLKSAYNMVNAEHNMKVSTLAETCEALRISPMALIHRGTLNLSLLASKRPERAVEALARMPVDQQRQAVEMLEAMVKK